MAIKKILFIIVVVIIGLYLFLQFTPFIIVGPPCPVYYIGNEDVIPHNITVEIFDEKNISVFSKYYTIESDSNIRFDRELQYNFPFPSKIVTWYDGKYTFNFTVDNNSSNEITRDINQYMSVTAIIKPSSNEDDEIVIDIKIMSV
jgi:ABC-type dipeptide/oligopeptide/nickel transport system permease component